MSLFESSITGNVLNNGQTNDTTGITGGQLSLVLTQYTPLETTTQVVGVQQRRGFAAGRHAPEHRADGAAQRSSAATG